MTKRQMRHLKLTRVESVAVVVAKQNTNRRVFNVALFAAIASWVVVLIEVSL